MSQNLFTRKVVVVAICLSATGATFCLFVRGGLGWWEDVFYLVMLGLLVGQSVGFSVMACIPHLRNSDGPVILCGAASVLLLVVLWLFLPEGAILVLAHVARALVGGAAGLLLVFGLAAMGAPYAPQDEGGGSD